MDTIIDKIHCLLKNILSVFAVGTILEFVLAENSIAVRVITVVTIISALLLFGINIKKISRIRADTDSAIYNCISGKRREDSVQEVIPYSKSVDDLIRYWIDLDERKKLLEDSIEQSRLMALQNQINPHFLYNTLDSIRADVLNAGLKETASVLEALASFFQYSISDLDHLATLNEELENAFEYFRIQKFRFGKNLRMEVHCDEPISKLYPYCLPKMSLQPIIENSISHGLEMKENKGTIIINIYRTQIDLVIQVIDDGEGMDKNNVDELNKVFRSAGTQCRKENRRGGIALANINNRIKLLFGDLYGLTVFSYENVGTNVQMEVPLTKKDYYDEKRIAPDR